MGRAERRRLEREKHKAKTATYNLTKQQLNDAIYTGVESKLKRTYNDGFNDGVNQALILLLTLPLEVLMDHYWTKSYQKKIPEFTNYILEYYEKWQNGELDMEALKQDLWEYGGVRLEVER